MTRTALIIPAAGTGSRFGGNRPKQFVDLLGEPVLAHTLRRFSGLVDHAWLAINEPWRAEVEAIIRTAPFPCTVVPGGSTRQASVHAALLAVTEDYARVLVHDAVRPLVPRSAIESCLAALAGHPAAVVAVPCAATIKRAGPGSVIAVTVPREDLWLAQTPQGFQRLAGLTVFAAAAAAGFNGTDDVQLFERQGLAVALVTGDACNLKLTTADDLAVAIALMTATR